MSDSKLILIFIGGLILNLFGSMVTEAFDLPVYMDTSGTIFIAALGGYAPGIAVGFFTNLLKAVLYEPTEMYFCSVNVFVAIFTAFFARRGFFDNAGKLLIIVPSLTFVTGTLDLLIADFLNSTNFLSSVNEFEATFAENIFNEAFDKSFSIVLAFVLLKLTPAHVKKRFHELGQRQAPLSDEMKRVVSKESYLSASLRTKTLAILMLSSLFASSSIALISYLLFQDSAVDERIKTVDGMVTVAVSEINPYRIDNYIKLGRAAEGYKETEEKLYAIKNSAVDAKYLYVYRFSERGCQVVFDLNTAMVEADKPGQIVEAEESLKPYMEDLVAGRPIPPIITDDEYGYLLTLYKPVYDGSGRCQCYVAVDFSMEPLLEYTHIFIIKLLALFAGCFIFIFAIGRAFVENNIILPVNSIAYCARNFSYDNTTAREENIKLIKDLKIKTGDEIENLYRALLRTTENFLRYLTHLQRAKTRVADMQVKVFAMDEIAHKDSLTGVKNKTAYSEEVAALDKKISAGAAEFCMVMVDVNYLKRVNDTYGHELGNTYLQNACRLTCAVFGAENVYRIGGDEFVVILEGEKVSLSKYFVAQFKSEMEHKLSNESLALWEKVSAAVGLATYRAGVDKSADEVFKRADEQMYANKLAMKAARTD
ncbi:MAG: GGDEF domain-containing protein [Selenomonadaceae bacterium]|nr:GGDEF domain-containing protein [Selenomonadaceae bacterium]